MYVWKSKESACMEKPLLAVTWWCEGVSALHLCYHKLLNVTTTVSRGVQAHNGYGHITAAADITHEMKTVLQVA